MKITFDRNDILEAVKPFWNGCSFRAIQREDGMSIEIGCYHLTNLQTGAGKALQEIIFKNSKNEVKLSDLELSEPHQEIQYAVLSIREQCIYCGGTQHQKTKERLKGRKMSNKEFSHAIDCSIAVNARHGCDCYIEVIKDLIQQKTEAREKFEVTPEMYNEKAGRFSMSISRAEFVKLQEEWHLHKEAHNGFDCYLAYMLLLTRKELEAEKVVTDYYGNYYNWVEGYIEQNDLYDPHETENKSSNVLAGGKRARQRQRDRDE